MVYIVGDKDWMYQSTIEPIRRELSKCSRNGKCHGIEVISNAGTQLGLENPERTTEMIEKY